MKTASATFSKIILFACLGGGFAAHLYGGEPSLSSPTSDTPSTPIPVAAPAAPATPPSNRQFGETELLGLLTAALQKDYVGDKGDLELRLTRPWVAQKVPDQTLTIKVLDLPNTGITPSFVMRFELLANDNSVGSWQVPLQARIMREIWVARSPLKQGDPVSGLDVARERRDVLAQRSPLADFVEGDTTLELVESVQAGSPLLARSLRARPVVHRGQMAEALVQDGTLSVSMKVEVLEDGAPGQYVRARNPISHRDISGKVLNEQTIRVSL